MIYFFFVLSILILIHEAGHFMAARFVGVRVEKFSFGFGPKILSLKSGDTEYLISAIPLGGYVKMAGDEPGGGLKNEKWEFLSRKPLDRFKIIFAGPFFNYILAFLIFSIIFMFGSPTLTTEVGGLLRGYPAEGAGVAVGDRIVSVNGKGVKYWEDMTEIIHRHTKGVLRLSLERQGRVVEMEMHPLVRETKDIFGNKVKLALIGVSPSQKIENVKHPFFQSFAMGFKKTLNLTIVTYKALFSVATGRLSVKESMTGPIGIFMITGQAARLGIIYLFHLMAILSASLAIFNLLPFPVLDGGHIIFLIVEKIRNKPLSIKTQELVQNIGIAFLIALTIFIFYNDIIKFGIFEKAVKFFHH